MGFFDWFKRDRKITDYTPEELRREEGRLKIRETQMIARLEKNEVEREEIFRRGFDVKSPVRRRLLARKFEEKEQELRRIERDLSRHLKESMGSSGNGNSTGIPFPVREGIIFLTSPSFSGGTLFIIIPLSLSLRRELMERIE